MVDKDKPVTLKLNTPLPILGVVTESITPGSPIVGLALVPITTPLAVTLDNPSLVMLPPTVALEVVMDDFVDVTN